MEIGSDGREGKPQLGETFRQMLGAESFEPLAVEQSRPENGASHLGYVLPVHACGQSRADNTACACASDKARLDLGFCKRLDDSYVSEPAHRAAAQGQADSAGA
jgi:hypothetical protein